MFSPYYAWARRQAGPRGADPLNHCALNVALYRLDGRRRWAMTERGSGRVRRSDVALQIGPSALRWQADGTLCIDIDEVSVPWLSRLRGQVCVRPPCRLERSYALDAQHLHEWQPIAPVASVEVDMARPGLRWTGTGYLDANRGSAPLEQDFARWHWSRAAVPGWVCAVLYDVQARRGADVALALRFDDRGGVEALLPPPRAQLPGTGWHIGRTTRCDAGSEAAVLRTLEDGPFYASSLVTTQIDGATVTAFHESLSLERFEQRWVQSLLPVRMPRLAR